MRAVLMTTRSHPDLHLIAGLLQEFTDGESCTLVAGALALERNRLAPFGGGAETEGGGLVAGHGFSGLGVV